MKSAVAILVLCLLGLTACGDDRPCAESHQETYIYYILVGKVLVPMTGTRTVCDVYA